MGRSFRSLVFDKHPLREYEPLIAKEVIREMKALRKRHRAQDSPLLVVRENAVLDASLGVRYFEELLARRMASLVAPAGVDERNRGEQAPWEALGKAQERLRKAVKDLEEYYTKTGSPIDIGLADLMKPVLKRAEGVLEDALEFESATGKRPAMAASAEG